MLDEDIREAIARLPCWSGPVAIDALAGGITNQNYCISERDGQRFVVRAGRDIPEHGIMRFHELAAARAAHAAGISPEVLYAGNGFLVSRFIDGRTLTPALVREPPTLERIVALLRRCHEEVPRHFQGPALIFWVFQVIRGYVGWLEAQHANPCGVPLGVLTERSAQLERAVGPVTLVFAHNDLLAANLIDDGQRLWLIDWDYGGFNSPLFDLANLASNNELPPALASWTLQSYFELPISSELRRGFDAMQCASLLRECLWGAVSHHTSALRFDYLNYAQEHLRRFEQRWQEFAGHHA